MIERRLAVRGARRELVLGLALILGMVVVPIPALAQPIQAVFFDLGDTLVEDAGGGMFGLRAGAAETVAAFQALGIEIGIITNVPAGWTRADLEAVLLEPEFLDEFSVLVLSSQAPASKPDPAIYTFAHGLLTTAVSITEVAFVGETLGEIANAEINPTEGCRAVGMVGVHLSDAAPSPMTDFTIPTDDLLQAVAIVDGRNTIFTDGFETGDTTGW